MLCSETYGTPATPGAPPIVLIGGAASSMDWWHPDFCTALAAATRTTVIRYDHRDTGQSPSSPPGRPGYTAADLADDVLTLADGPLHLVGLSMGGAIAQRIAIEHPGRVASLTLIDTTFAAGGPDGLPPPTDRIRDRFSAPPPDWHDRDAAVEHITADIAACAGTVTAAPDEVRDLARRVFDRTTDLAAAHTNHYAVADGRPLTGRTGDITAPTVVLHGTEDPLFPLEHGRALAAAIPGARLVPLPGMGHEVPPRPLWPAVIAEIRRAVDSVPHTTGR
ncbi:alpha/beta fold hydrolase [Dactylosporangium sp. CA-139066]|uniref:alpha/beta fold hydrolase n=1 Tax=Dactylosporangium sp. CA-139066 TaxID=3239930 RepID=UPI003D8ABD63